MWVETKKTGLKHKGCGGEIIIIKIGNAKGEYSCLKCDENIKDLKKAQIYTHNKVNKYETDDISENKRVGHLYSSIKARYKKRIDEEGKSWKEELFFPIPREKLTEQYLTKKKKEKKSKYFVDWYKKQPQKCSYCGTIREELEQIAELVNQGKIINKRHDTRGLNLEVDRKDDNDGYNYHNCCLACYWCNNAKTDTFDEKDFELIGKAIGNALKIKIPNNKKKLILK